MFRESSCQWRGNDFLNRWPSGSSTYPGRWMVGYRNEYTRYKWQYIMIPENWSFERERIVFQPSIFQGLLLLVFRRVVPGGSLPAIRNIGAHNSTYRGEITPATHMFSAMYRGYFTPFITTSWWLNQSPSEKYWSNWKSSPILGVKIKHIWSFTT